MRQTVQGDILIEKCSKIPAGAKPVKPINGKHVIAEGEATGHAHTIDESVGDIFELEGVLYLKAKQAGTIEHQEHAAQKITKGITRFVRQREFTDADEPRPVRD